MSGRPRRRASVRKGGKGQLIPFGFGLKIRNGVAVDILDITHHRRANLSKIFHFPKSFSNFFAPVNRDKSRLIERIFYVRSVRNTERGPLRESSIISRFRPRKGRKASQLWQCPSQSPSRMQPICDSLPHGLPSCLRPYLR